MSVSTKVEIHLRLYYLLENIRGNRQFSALCKTVKKQHIPTAAWKGKWNTEIVLWAAKATVYFYFKIKLKMCWCVLKILQTNIVNRTIFCPVFIQRRCRNIVVRCFNPWKRDVCWRLSLQSDPVHVSLNVSARDCLALLFYMFLLRQMIIGHCSIFITAGAAPTVKPIYFCPGGFSWIVCAEASSQGTFDEEFYIEHVHTCDIMVSSVHFIQVNPRRSIQMFMLTQVTFPGRNHLDLHHIWLNNESNLAFLLNLLCSKMQLCMQCSNFIDQESFAINGTAELDFGLFVQ